MRHFHYDREITWGDHTRWLTQGNWEIHRVTPGNDEELFAILHHGKVRYTTMDINAASRWFVRNGGEG